MGGFEACMIEFDQYPSNLPMKECSPSKLRNYKRRLDEQSEDLFDENKPRLGCLDYRIGKSTFDPLQDVSSMSNAEQLCPSVSSQEGQNALESLQCRFIFLHSKNSREALYTRRDVLMMVLSYHLVQAWFLDYLFLFGEQEQPLDARFTAFRSQTYLSEEDRNLGFQQTRRSGIDYHLCYNLRAPEESQTNKYMPWSIRQSVMYHSFDIQTGHSFWMNLKGNDSMKRDLTEEAQRHTWRDASLDNSKTCAVAFQSSLLVHLFMCEWARDTWRRYIIYLESQVTDLTELAVVQRFEERPMPKHASCKTKKKAKRANTIATILSATSWRTALSRRNTKDSDISLRGPLPFGNPAHQDWHDTSSGYQDEFNLPNLQQSQGLEEKISQAVFFAQGNVKNIKALANFYANVNGLPNSVASYLGKFNSQLLDIVQDMEMHQTSLMDLKRKMTERKNLLFAILEYQNMKASEYFAAKAQISAHRMEEMTEEMRVMTEKTKKETVSMKAIAGVTMVFLPGTFVSTLMSTDIVKWEYTTDGRVVRRSPAGAWQFFLSLTLPLMVVTFLAWGSATLWFNRKDRHRVAGR